ncbi:MAG: diguanylate cyclase [Desulfuromonadales bacterium]|nr:diguanylate cyclase [Desulfuromonadales bacterium]
MKEPIKKPIFTLTRKVAAGYLLIVAFSMVAIVYALGSLHDQTSRSERLISVEFQALGLARTLQQNLLAQETLEKQFLILRDQAFLDLLERRREELDQQWRALASLPLPEFLQRTAAPLTRYRQQEAACRELLASGAWPQAQSCSLSLSPLRQNLLAELETFLGNRQALLDQSLIDFNLASARAYRITLLLAFIGIGLSAPAAMAIVLGIHRSVTALTRATREIAAGSFDFPIPLTERRDEFGMLAREFRTMGQKLTELEKLRLDANPLTHLPGNLAIDRELETRLQTATPFAHLYIDLDHFKAYNDRYGYRAGSEIIARVGNLVRDVVGQHGNTGDLIGHIGGDDFVVITSIECAEPVAKEVLEGFDRMVPSFYSEEDRLAGFFVAEDRFGEKRTFPLLTVSVAVVVSSHLDVRSPQAVSRACVSMKEHLKTLPGSNYLIDRRRIT